MHDTHTRADNQPTSTCSRCGGNPGKGFMCRYCGATGVTP